MYSFTLSLTSALDAGGWLAPCPSCFSPRMTNRILKQTLNKEVYIPVSLCCVGTTIYVCSENRMKHINSVGKMWSF